jgi:hypothetical protein
MSPRRAHPLLKKNNPPPDTGVEALRTASAARVAFAPARGGDPLRFEALRFLANFVARAGFLLIYFLIFKGDLADDVGGEGGGGLAARVEFLASGADGVVGEGLRLLATLCLTGPFLFLNLAFGGGGGFPGVFLF